MNGWRNKIAVCLAAFFLAAWAAGCSADSPIPQNSVAEEGELSALFSQEQEPDPAQQPDPEPAQEPAPNQEPDPEPASSQEQAEPEASSQEASPQEEAPSPAPAQEAAPASPQAEPGSQPPPPPAEGEPAPSSATEAPPPSQEPEQASQQLPAQSTEPQAPARQASSSVLVPSSPGEVVLGNASAEIDASNASEGYITVRYMAGSSNKIKVQITNSTTYTYDLDPGGSAEVFPLTEGNGTYTVAVFENVSGTSYAPVLNEQVSVSLRSQLLPFLYPNQYVNFWSGSNTVQIAAQLASTCQTDVQVVEQVYNYTMSNISYDDSKAAAATAGQIAGYLPSVDNVLATGRGICFDYAAVMTAMLRSQGIPTKLVVGWSGQIYHAWISTYLQEEGWVSGIIHFDGQSWKRMDPTFADNGNQSASIMQYIENNGNYNPLYLY